MCSTKFGKLSWWLLNHNNEDACTCELAMEELKQCMAKAAISEIQTEAASAEACIVRTKNDYYGMVVTFKWSTILVS